MRVPVDDEIHLVPSAVGEGVHHADEVHLLIVEVAEAEERHVMPLVQLREVRDIRSWDHLSNHDSLVAFLHGDLGCRVGSCEESRVVYRCQPQIARLNCWVVGLHLEGDVLGCVVWEVDEYSVVIGARRCFVLRYVEVIVGVVISVVVLQGLIEAGK